MRTKITASIRRALQSSPAAHSDVHFHTDAAGRPFVCDVVRCDSAALSEGELGVTRR
ncbi:MAG: hypothetical protein WBQ18_04220 [Solirubrobacteraceae bacterium]|jgi:hypothetical protein